MAQARTKKGNEGAAAEVKPEAEGAAPAAGEGEGEDKGPSKAELSKLERMDEAFDKIERLLFRLGQQGLQRMSRSSADELRALEQVAHNAALVSIERQIETLATHVQRYLDRDPLFAMADYMGTINKIWLLSAKAKQLHRAGKMPDEMTEIIGEARRSYEELKEPLVLQSLGASGWVTDTDFVGITIYFYVDGKPGVTYQASNCKPCAYFGRDPKRLLFESISEYVPHSIFEMAHGAFRFENVKLSSDGRLSIHKDLKVSKQPYLGARAYATLAVRNWVELVDKLRKSELHPIGGAGSMLVYVEPTGFGKVVQDDKNARSLVEVVDDRGAVMLVEIPHRSENNTLIDNLEKMFGKATKSESEEALAAPQGKRKVPLSSGKKLVPNGLFGQARIGDGRLKLFPYTALYNNPVVSNQRDRRRVNEIHLSLEQIDRFSPGDETP